MKTVTFVVPMYNEEKRIQKTFDALVAFRAPREIRLEKIIFVNDGSTDKTVQVIKNFIKTSRLSSQIKLVTYSKNQGKGNAVKEGMLNSNSDYTLFFDADISTPLSEIKKFIPYFEKNENVVIGTRKNGKSTVVVHQPKKRELLGKGFTKLTQTILGVHVTDFTCGFKAFSNNACSTIFSQAQIKGWGYDAEIIYLAEKEKFKVVEIPVTWYDDKRSRVVLYKAIPQSLFELFTILYYHKYKGIIQFFTLPLSKVRTRIASVL